ncbi:MAG: hypothetical protein ACJAR8_001647 [Bacteroidia bacterium]|jgi:hypothetical protein
MSANVVYIKAEWKGKISKVLSISTMHSFSTHLLQVEVYLRYNLPASGGYKMLMVKIAARLRRSTLL